MSNIQLMQGDCLELMKNIPDTTDSMLSPTSKYYKEYSKDELVELSKL
jgi:hypothetical protein